MGLTSVLTHTIAYPGTPTDNELEDLYNYVIPRYKASGSIAWTIGPVTTTFYGQKIGGLPNYAGTERLPPTYVYNASLAYHISKQADLSLACDNVFNTPPQYRLDLHQLSLLRRQLVQPGGALVSRRVQLPVRLAKKVSVLPR